MSLTKVFAIPLRRVWVAKLASGALAMTLSFLLNRRWVFGTSGPHRAHQAGRFLVTTITASWAVQLGLIHFFSSAWPVPGRASFSALQGLGVPKLASGILTEAAVIKTAAFGLATCASSAWNFVLYRLWVFPDASG
jgi:putative flippase GtrA